MANFAGNLEGYYENPIMECWTYVSMGMDTLRNYDFGAYNKIKDKQSTLFSEINQQLKNISQICEKLEWNCKEVEFYIDQFLQKFPLALRSHVGWDDLNFIFLYLLTRILKPEVIIEAGCNVGFSSAFFALAIKENDNGCKFYTIEPNLEYTWEDLSFVKESSKRKQNVKYKPDKCGALYIVPSDLREYIILMPGYPRDIFPDLLKEDMKVDIFFHDSDHAYRNMVWECATVLPKVKTGGYIFVHDILSNSLFRKMFIKKRGVVIGNNLGIFKKTNEASIFVDNQLNRPLENSQFNNHEYKLKRIELKSSPKNIVIQGVDCYGSSRIFCSGSNDCNVFDSEMFREKLEGKICRYFFQAEKIIFTGYDDFFQLSDVRDIFIYFQCSFDETDKVFYTNGMGLTLQICDLIFNEVPLSGKNVINVLLSASSSHLYKVVAKGKAEDFCKIISQIKNLLDLRKEKNKGNLIVNFNFMITALNVKDLPDFVKLAANLGVDKVICKYGYIYTPAQKYLSCFFEQELTNRMFDEAEDIAHRLNIDIELPPKFAQKEYSNLGLCRKPWSEIIIDTQGNFLSCDGLEKVNESLQNKDFMNIWNDFYYQNLRRSLIEGNSSCFEHCFRANPVSVNDFRSHVIHRGKNNDEIDLLGGIIFRKEKR
ncbi:MAG: class I SAM-dependent methyltransferase [Candidatus Omnitrophota bacterium]